MQLVSVYETHAINQGVEPHTTCQLRLAGTCGEHMRDSHPWEVPEIWHYGTRAVTVELDMDCMAPTCRLWPAVHFRCTVLSNSMNGLSHLIN